MKRSVWLASLLLVVAFVFPNGIPLSVVPAPTPSPTTPVTPNVPADPTIANLLMNAPAADKARIVGIYSALIDVVRRDAGKIIRTTEHWAMLQDNTLKLAVDATPLKGKYPGLDVAIESVFEARLGKEKEVAQVDEPTRNKIIDACNVVIASAQ